MPRVYIGVGSNINRDTNIRSAVVRLGELGWDLQVSPVYESKAYGFTGDNFYNLAVGMETELPPEALTDSLREIEDAHGRRRGEPKYSSRTLDLDLLVYGGLVRHDDILNVPRRDITGCAFVLRPLADIAGDLVHPETGEKIAAIWRAFDRPDQALWQVDIDLAVQSSAGSGPRKMGPGEG